MVVRSEAGNSLVEVLVAVSILGIAVVALVSGMGVAVAGSDSHRKQSESQTLLVQAAEIVKRADFKSCDDTTLSMTNPPYSVSSVTAPTGFDAPKITKVQVSNGDGAFLPWWDNTGTAPTFTFANCPSANIPKLELVTIEVRSTDGRALETTSVAKRYAL